MYQQLAQLIRDGVWLKSYLAAVMRLEQEAFQVQRAHASVIAHLVPSQAQIVSQAMPQRCWVPSHTCLLLA